VHARGLSSVVCDGPCGASSRRRELALSASSRYQRGAGVLGKSVFVFFVVSVSMRLSQVSSSSLIRSLSFSPFAWGRFSATLCATLPARCDASLRGKSECCGRRRRPSARRSEHQTRSAKSEPGSNRTLRKRSRAFTPRCTLKKRSSVLPPNSSRFVGKNTEGRIFLTRSLG
jgi:hypothetical protein